MLSHITRLVTFWIFSASSSAESRLEQHPLCFTLENREHQQPTHFPSAYTCLGDDDGAVCTSLSTDIRDERGRKEEPGGITWWVYRGRREHVSGTPEYLSYDEWVDCTDYYARRSLSIVPAKDIGASPMRRFVNMSETSASTERMSGDPTPNAAKGTPPSFPGPHELRRLPADDARSAAKIKLASNWYGSGNATPIDPSERGNSFVYAPNATCDDVWLSWPAVQERAIADGTVLVMDVFTSVGNLFLTFDTTMKFVRLFELGLVLRGTNFPGFEEVFSPSEINWSVDAEPFMQQVADMEEGVSAAGFHPMKFQDYAMVLSDSQLELLALMLGVSEPDTEALAAHFRKELPNHFHRFMNIHMQIPLRKKEALKTQPCTWNMLLSRSPSMMASLEQHSPWGVMSDASGPRHQAADYIAWHIRTPEGETAKSYTPTTHRYVIQEPSSDVCPTYLMAMEDSLQLAKSCHTSLNRHAAHDLVYISSNSKPMAKDCAVEAANHDIVMGHVDLGLSSRDAHTKFSHNPIQTAIGAFLDFFFLLDATVIVRTASSFSGTVCSIKGLKCEGRVYDSLPKRVLYRCLPSDC